MKFTLISYQNLEMLDTNHPNILYNFHESMSSSKLQDACQATKTIFQNWRYFI